MRCRPRYLVAMALGAAILAGPMSVSAPAQAPAVFNPQGGLGAEAPWLPPTGMWAEVLTATPQWMVLQTADGRQLPLSYNNIGLFVIRWPTAPARLSPAAWLEVTGIDLGTNRVLTDHVDVYEGAARNLVTPTSLVLVGLNRVLTQYEFGHMSMYGTGFQMMPGEEYLPQRRHIVGPVASIAPLSVAVPGNNAVAILPAGGGMSMTQVTPGSSSYVRPGDIVWCVPEGANPRSLILSQLVLYKSLPFEQFVP